MKNQIVWTQVKKVDSGEDGTAYFKGGFPAVIKEIKKGNVLKGIALKSGQVGFMFTSSTEVDLEEVLTPKEPLEAVKAKPEIKSRDGEVVMLKGRRHIIREIPIYGAADELSDKISQMTNVSKERIFESAFEKGFVEIALEATVEKMRQVGANPQKILKAIDISIKDAGFKSEADLTPSMSRIVNELRNTANEVIAKEGNEELPKGLVELLELIKKEGAEVEVKVEKVEVKDKGGVDALLKKLGLK